MKVLLLNQFFYPDLAATAQLATDLAEDLASHGADVTALAARGTYLGGARLPPEERHRGVRIVRVPCASLGKRSISRRMVDYGSFLASAALRLLARERPDVVVSMSTPPLVAALGAAMRAKRARFVYWVQDVYPELAFEFGVLRRGSVPARALDATARGVLACSDAIIGLGDAMARRLVDKGASESRVHVIPNWADGRALRPVPHEQNAFRQRNGIGDRRVVLYSGNMGRGHDMWTLLEAARAMRGEDVVFLFIGDGARRREVEAAARECPSIRLLPYQDREALSESLSAGDLHLVAQDPATLGLMEPSKLYGILAAGRPVLYVGPRESEVACAIRREQVGRVVRNGDVAGAVAAIRDMLSCSSALGARARAAFERGYDRQQRTAEFSRVLQLVMGSGRRCNYQRCLESYRAEGPACGQSCGRWTVRVRGATESSPEPLACASGGCT